MRGLLITLVGVACLTLGAFELRRRWVRDARHRIDEEIARNRFRRRKGMERMDEPLRDETRRRRTERETQLEAFKRELDNPPLRLQRRAG